MPIWPMRVMPIPGELMSSTSCSNKFGSNQFVRLLYPTGKNLCSKLCSLFITAIPPRLASLLPRPTIRADSLECARGQNAIGENHAQAMDCVCCLYVCRRFCQRTGEGLQQSSDEGHES